ncbi:MAG: hypothetical protein KDA83_15270, partial [Planctomycetales bacterium]|nr:hypothetical protein [Planctomycetales bacterium]
MKHRLFDLRRLIGSWCCLCGLLIFWLCGLMPSAEACTTAVISGRITRDGRPILWKNRDYASAPRNEVALLTGGRFRVLAVVNAGSRSSVWMGMNEAGLCIENSLSTDLAEEGTPKGPGNGLLMKQVLQSCATVAEVREWLERTNETGRATTANFGVIDAEGGAAIFEAGPTRFVMFDANDPVVAPHGYLVRSNFATTARELGASPEEDEVGEVASGERYARACRLLEATDSDAVSLEYVVHRMTRDLADEQGESLPGSINASDSALPNLIATANTISRNTTVSAAVFHGVRPGEDPKLTTMWAILGDPKFSVAVPCWVSIETVADPLEGDHGGEIGEIARTLRDASLTADGQVRGEGLPGIWQDVWPVEQRLLTETLEARERWLADGVSERELADWHDRAAQTAFAAMQRELVEAKDAVLHAEFAAQDESVNSGVVRVAIYDHSDGSANGPRNLLRILNEDAGFSASRVTPQQIRDGVLGEFDVLIMPGGSGSAQSKNLEPEGRAEVTRFVNDGGGYVGICA